MTGKGWNLMEQIRLVATDIDGTFVHADHHYDQVRFHRIFEKCSKQIVILLLPVVINIIH